MWIVLTVIWTYQSQGESHLSEELSAEALPEATPAVTEETQEVAETSEQAVTEESTEQVTEPVEEPSNVQKRIDQLTAKRYAAENERDQMRQKLDAIELERQQEILNKAPPTEAQFDYDTEAHNKAVQDHYYAQWQAQGQATELRNTQIREAQAAQAMVEVAYNTRVEEFKIKAPDFMTSVGSLVVPQDVEAYFKRDAQGPQMAYVAAKNAEISAKLNSFDPNIRNQGLVDIKLKIAGSPKANNISSAGEPNTSQIQTGLKAEQDDFMKKFPNAEIM